MKFPATNKRAMRRVSIPEFTGGLNLRDNPTQCNDNQLTELVNMWYKDGTLRTRPAMKSNAMGYIETLEYSNCYDFTFKPKIHNNITRVNDAGYTEKLVSFIYSGVLKEGSGKSESIRFLWAGKGMTEGYVFGSVFLDDGEEIKNYFVCSHGGTIYCFVKTLFHGYIYKFDNNGFFRKVSEEEIHIPTVATYCMSSHILNNLDDLKSTVVNYEAFNMLSDYYKMVYSTVSPYAAVTEGKYLMCYTIMESITQSKYIGYTVKAEYVDKNGNTHKHCVEIKNSNYVYNIEENVSTDGLKMGVCDRQILFYTANNEYAYLTEEDFVEENMIITAPFLSDKRDKIFNMSCSEWFGGASAGMVGGTRLFLCGSKAEEDKALVIWSALNNPLYFPEYSYFNVGDTSQSVTGFGRMADMLVIFKENEVWYTQYHQNNEVTAETLINQSVIDIQSGAIYFPLVRINANIGCRYPDTIELCRNRLVWLGNQNRVYSLVTDNQYNERSIFVVSDMIDSYLGKESITEPCAFDWNGYYCLQSGKHLYLMDYNSYGYIYISSHSKTEDSNKRIPWYYWEFEIDGRFFQSDEELFLISFYENWSHTLYEVCGFENGKYYDEASNETLGNIGPIKSILQTKIFDFGEPHNYKNVHSVGLSLGHKAECEFNVKFITDGGEEQTGLFLENAAEERSASFTKTQILMPSISQVLRFGIRIESKDYICIDGIEIDYRVTGRAR